MPVDTLGSSVGMFRPSNCPYWARSALVAHSSIRFGLGRFTTKEEIDFAIEQTVQHVTRLRELSPLWEMVQEGIDLKSIEWSQH